MLQDSKCSEVAARNPYLSVVIPLHKFDARLPQLIHHMTESLNRGIQIVLVLDGLSEVDQDFPQELHVLRSRANFSIVEVKSMNPGEARNAGLRDVNGTWITFWDSDDVPNIDNCLRMCDSAEKAGKQVAIGGFCLVSQISDKESSQRHYLGRSRIRNVLRVIRYPGIWRWVFKRQIIGGNRFPKSSMGEDLFFLSGLNINLRDTYFSTEIVYNYYKWSETQLTANPELRVSSQTIDQKKQIRQKIFSTKSSLLSKLLLLRIYSFLIREQSKTTDARS